MTQLIEFMDVMIDEIEKNCNLNEKISLKELKSEGGIYAEVGESFAETVNYNKEEIKMVPILFLCRHKDQRQCMEWLGSICNYLQRLKKYPQGKYFSWLDTSIKKEPGKIGRDEDGVYHYSCILACKIFY